MEKLKLRYHDCYPPFFILYDERHLDRAGVPYWRAFCRHPLLPNVGFIVREDLFGKWSQSCIAGCIAEITFGFSRSVTEFETEGAIRDRIQVDEYLTFDEIRKQASLIEIRGIYIEGVFESIDPATNENEIIHFIPSIPNRYRFWAPYYDIEWYTLKGFWLSALRKLPMYSGYTDRFIWEQFSEAIYFYVVVNIQRTHWEFEYGDFGKEVEPEFEHQAIVFASTEEFVIALRSIEKYKPETIQAYEVEIKSRLANAKANILRLKQLKKISEIVIGVRHKFEHEINILEIDPSEYSLFNQLSGQKYNPELAANGLEIDDDFCNFDEILRDPEGGQCDKTEIYITVSALIQV